MAKERIDVLLVERNYFESRERAQKNIMAGMIFVDGLRVDKVGTKVSTEAQIEVRGQAIPYVSRGGLKLEKTIKTLDISLEGKRCMDIGASTGGFTDCMLQHGAMHVHAVDVGYGQLDWKLRTDPRVTNMERTNIRYVTRDHIEHPLDFISIDVSFISLKLVLPVALSLLDEQGAIVFLIKPQFEAGREQVKKSGVIRDEKVHIEVLRNILLYCDTIDLKVDYLTYSPIKGPKGNIEFLAYAQKHLSGKQNIFDIDQIVTNAHLELATQG